jgi:TolB-like protein/tRNA A-37 threonylcarbamoyl transferase component Bud32
MMYHQVTAVTPERWKQVKDLMDAALGVPPRERESFVAESCGADEELRREVLSLLESHEDAGDFLESPALDVKNLARPQVDLSGTRIGPWELVREIGRGGMGAVYLATRADNEFRKRVAVKLIRHDMESGFAVHRFRNERQILARLEHPNIARLIDGGTTGDGVPYFIMEYVEGEPLLAYCESRALPLDERVRIFQRVCSAVEYAHRRMIIHRDLKPGNILVKADGTPKLLDFGVAKILDPEHGDTESDVTLPGFRLITPAYASPEQVRGERATVGSDIFTLGLVLWELITGRQARPENGRRSFELNTAPHDTAWRLTRSLQQVVIKAAREKPSERYESVEAMAADLDRALKGEEITPAATAGSAAPAGSLAVLPFQYLGTDTSESYLGLGIADAVITRLSNFGQIAVRPTGAVMKFAAGCEAGQAGRELRVQYVLEGRVQRAGDRVRVTVQLVEVESANPVWAAGFDEQLEDLLRMEDSISAQVAQALLPQMTGEEQEEGGRSGTASPKAYQTYLRGRWYWNQHTEETLPHALVLFTEAVVDDPKFGRAHAGIADYHIALGMRGLLPPVEAFAAAMQSARTAIGLDPKLAEAHASLGLATWIHDGDWETAAHHLQLAIALNPEYAPAHDWFGLMNAGRNRSEIAMASIERARRLDPNSAVFFADLAMCHYNARDYGQAEACFTQAGADGRIAPPIINGAVLPLAQIAAGEPARALDSARAYFEGSGQSLWSMATLARAEGAVGNDGSAQTLLADLLKRAQDYYVSGTALALAHLACGDRHAAVRNLERACRDREWWTTYLAYMPAWDELRGNSRFDRLTRPGRKRTAVTSAFAAIARHFRP